MLCLKCATILEDDMAECHTCGEPIDHKAYERILEKANQYILFGYHYRKAYEDQYLRLGTIETKYHLGILGESFAWLGLSVLSGVIGGASWDFVKSLSKKIASQLKSKDISQIVSDDEQLRLFSEYMLDYHHSFKNIKDEIREALLEEMEAHAAEGLDLPSQIDFSDRAQLIRLKKQVVKRANTKRSKSKISVSIVKNLWGKTKLEIKLENEEIHTEPTCVGGGEDHAAPNT